MPDHILVSAAMAARLRSADVLNDDLEDEHPDFRDVSSGAASYHAPLFADFAD